MAAVLPVQTGLNARVVALSLVCLACVFIILWVAIGAGIHKSYVTPGPVRNSPLFYILSSLLTLLGVVLVLDQPASVPGSTPWWRILVVVDRTICLDNTIHSTVLLGRGFLVGR